MSIQKWLPAMAFIAATAVVGLAATPADASAPDGLHPRSGTTLPIPPVDSDQSIADLLTLPPVTEEQNAWMGQLDKELGQAENYVSTELARDRKTITVTWFGEAGQALSSLLASPPPATATLLRKSPYSGGALRAALARAFAQPLAGVEAVSGGIAVDGTSIHVEVKPLQQGARVDVGSLAATIGEGVPVAVTVTDESVIPFYGSWNDANQVDGGAVDGITVVGVPPISSKAELLKYVSSTATSVSVESNTGELLSVKAVG